MYTKTTQNLYNKLPEVYRVADFKEGNETLLRYLSALDEGGIATLQQDIANLYSIMSIEKAPTKAIPLIGNMLGFNYIRDLDDRTQRKIVENLAELYKRKGTKSVIHFIAREFTKGDVKIVEMENRMFRTWAKESKLVPPSERRITPRTFNGKKINENTFYLLSKEGKHSIGSVIILIESVTDLPLLNRLLLEFLPVSCKVYLQLMGVERFEESMTLHSPDKQTEAIVDQEQAPIDVTEDNVQLHMFVLDTDDSIVGTESKHVQFEKVHKDIMRAIIGEDETTKLRDTSREKSNLVSDSKNTLQYRLYSEEIAPIETTTQESVSLNEVGSEEIELLTEDEHETFISTKEPDEVEEPTDPEESEEEENDTESSDTE